MQKIKDDINIKKLYGRECTLEKEDFIKEYTINLNGLSNNEVLSFFNKFGYNEISKSKPKNWYNFLFQSLFNPFNSILLGITLILIYTDIIFPVIPNYANIIVILVLVLSSTILNFIQEYRSNKSAEKLKEMVATTCTVLRDGKELKIPIKNITIGDIVLLSSGSMIPADLRILESNNLYIKQSSLTGESDAIKKFDNSNYKFDDINSILDLDTICFMGSSVVSGTAKCAVIKIADNTYLGKVADNLTLGKPPTSFQKGINNISKLLIKFMLIMIIIVFLLTVTKYEILTAFTFSVAIAIGITPLLLPVILSSSLSKGAIKMSKKQTIVKSLRLNSNIWSNEYFMHR